MDQFTYAERATDWRGNNTIAASIFEQMRNEPHPVPAWAVVGAGTGGTSATIGRYVRYRRLETQVCVVDPEGSVFAEYHRSRDASLTCPHASRIEGIGRPCVEPSFLPEIIDRMIRVPDAASIAAAHVAARWLARPPGASTGTNVFGVLQLVAEMLEQGRTGSIVSLVCDSGDRYAHTCYDLAWLAEQRLHIAPYVAQIDAFLASGRWPAGAALAGATA
jgi:cysteine synthase A